MNTYVVLKEVYNCVLNLVKDIRMEMLEPTI